MSEDVLERVEHQFMCSQRELPVASSLFIEGTSHALLKFTVRIGDVAALVAKIVEMNHELKVFREFFLLPPLE